MKPLVSIIMPVYNQEEYIVETIESVLSQTFQDYEFLILDDGSTDSSAKIIKQYAAKDERIVALFQSNAGKASATNTLVKAAKGQWCALLDADDVMLPSRLEKQVPFLKLNPDLDACSCHCYYIDQEGNNLGQQCYPYLKTIEDCKQAKANNKVILCSFTGMMVSTKAYLESGGLIGKFWPGEDVEFINRLVEKGYLIVIMQEKLMKYRVHPFSVTNSNLWHSYVEISGYIHHSMALRRENKPEISFEDFMNLRKKEPWWMKLDKKRYFFSKMFHREAGFDLYTKKYLHFFWKIAVASLLSPNYVFASMRNRLKLSSLAEK